ncbi:hypothetical protein P9112_008743 [Eukaryota sp. TZLM1-RC]
MLLLVDAIFEFSERFADWEDSLMTTQSSTVFALNEEISKIDLILRHALNCSKLITYRSLLHDAVRDTAFNMARTVRISCIKEPLLKETLSLNNFGSDDRGDVYCDWIDNFEAVIDFVSCNVAHDTLVYRKT